MTEPRETERDRPTDPRADREPVVKPEVIKDLDVTHDDTENIAGGKSAKCGESK
jgi:hypothetical protein